MSTSVGIEAADAGIDSTEAVVSGGNDNSLQPSVTPSEPRTRTPPPPSTAGNNEADTANDQKHHLQASPSIRVQEAPSTITATNPYSSLQYAPRQKPTIAHRPSQSSFQSHSSSWKQTASSSTLSEPSILSTFPHSAPSASSPVVSTMAIEGQTASDEQVQKNAEQISAAETLAKQQLRADAEELGVRVGSLGWAILEQIYSAPNAEWTELGELLNRGEAILLLPTSPLHSSEVTLSQAYNHIIFSTLQSNPPGLFTSSVKGKERDDGSVTLVTFKGLRADLIDDADSAHSVLHFTSFIPREDMKFVSQMRTPSRRKDLFKTLNPLPGTSRQGSSPPRFSILAHASSLLLPPSLSRREIRSRSSSNGTLLSVEQRQSNRASATFATLFGGRRERKTSLVAPGDNGQELKEASEASDSIHVVQPTRVITVAVIDGEIRRSQVLKDIAAGTKASIKLRLMQGTHGHLPNNLIDVVCSFTDMFVPPSATSTHATNAALSASMDTDHSRLGSNAPLLAPFLYTPDQLSDIFQDFYTSIKAQLQEVEEDHDIQSALQQVEAVVCSEVYDRIFCPYTSTDMYHDEALSSRIEVLDQMGISLHRLGLLLVEDESEESTMIQKGLNDIVKRCGTQLQLLEDRRRLSPGDKLDVLVTAHKIIVEGLGKLPKIELLDEADAKEAAKNNVNDDDAEAGEEEKPTSSTSSADLILPILIYCIVKSKTSRLASNLLYIQRFHAEALARGEADYCLVNVQAAVAFLENVEAASLGLASDVRLVTAAELEQQRRKEESNGQFAAQASQSLPVPARMRSRVAHDVGEMAGMSNRVITGVLGSSLGAFGRMMGAGTNYAMGIDAAATNARVNGGVNQKQKSIEDIRGFLSGGGAAAKLGSVLNKVVAMENEGKVGRDTVEVKRPLPLNRRKKSSTQLATDYGAESIERRSGVVNSSSLPASSKASITDRLASLPHLSRTATGSPTPSTSQLEPVSPAFSAKESSRMPTSRGGSLRLNSYKSTLGTLRRDDAALRSPISAVSVADHNVLLSPLNATSAMPGGASYTQTHIPASLQSPFPPLSSPPTRERPLHVVLASTGSVASIKIPLMIESLLAHANVRIQVISTKASSHFYDKEAVLAKEMPHGERKPYTVSDLAKEMVKANSSDNLTEHDYPRLHFWSDEDEWQQWNRIGDSILHIELRRWADVVLIAPCSANTLAKINAGLCDDLLTSFLRALSPTTPTYLFPAMNTLMYMHPLTASHLAFAREVLGYHIIGPIEKRLACGDLGQGAMQEWSDIVDLVVNKYGLVPAMHDHQEEAAV